MRNENITELLSVILIAKRERHDWVCVCVWNESPIAYTVPSKKKTNKSEWKTIANIRYMVKAQTFIA